MIASAPKRLLSVLALAALTGLAGCGGDVTRTFGLTRDAPDEFSVTTRAPLSMPPSDKLHPPTPGASRPQEQQAATAAAATLVPQAALSANGRQPPSPGEQALVNAAGPAAPADIRTKVDADAALAATDRSFTDRLLFWRAAPTPGTPVDPQREAQRLRENAALGQPSDVGDTPIIQPAKKSFFDSLF